MVPGTILPPSNVHSCLIGFMLNRARGSVSTHCAHGEHLDITPPLNSHCLLCQRDPSVKVMLVKNDTRDCKEIKVKELIKKNELQKRKGYKKRERESHQTVQEWETAAQQGRDSRQCLIAGLCSQKHQREAVCRQLWMVRLGETHADQPRWGTGGYTHPLAWYIPVCKHHCWHSIV